MEKNRTVYHRPEWVNKMDDFDKASSLHDTQKEAVMQQKKCWVIKVGRGTF